MRELIIALLCLAGCGPSNPCFNGRRDPGETDVDCGGAACPKCQNGLGCRQPSDCASGFCGGVCVPPCNNNLVKDAQESDIDCGGPACPKCHAGKACNQGSDCVTGACDAGLCAAAATCSNHIKDGDESDVDCGGACLPCRHGQGCRRRCDCFPPFCENGVCTSCGDGIADGDEAGIDCGGSCGKCPLGKTCLVNSDCESGDCEVNHCDNRPLCFNNVRDPGETDLNCGGVACTRCDDGKRCLVDDDCMSGLCANGLCARSSCKCFPGSFCRNGVCLCDERSCPGCCSGENCGKAGPGFGYCAIPPLVFVETGRGKGCECEPGGGANSCYPGCTSQLGKCCLDPASQDPASCLPLTNDDFCRDPRGQDWRCFACPCN
jgi:hypothetical protein